ncbi:MAG: dienelactone hydrolase family protein [Pseudomonadota bacterium]|nr:dienelactone hydrolase family protein [Pseudomonadota bacterium]
MEKQQIDYSEGRLNFRGQLFWDESLRGRRPGVIVFPEAFGLNEHALIRARRLAELGYVAFAADPHGDGTVFPDLPSLSPAIRALYGDRNAWRARLRAAFDALCAQPQVDSGRIAAIGYCFGGTCCLELARSGASLAAIVTFHAGLIAEVDGDAGRVKAKVLICNGADDTMVKPEVLDAVIGEFRRDGVDWQLIHYGNTVHSFTNPDADERGVANFRYSAVAERRSWAAMRGFMEEVFG